MMVEIPMGISKKRWSMIAIPEKPVIGNSAARAKLCTAAAMKLLPSISQSKSAISVLCFIGDLVLFISES